jgi:hypothetical protein
VKQLDFECPQVVQKPFALSFHVPVLLLPRCGRGSRGREGLAREKGCLNLARRHRLCSKTALVPKSTTPKAVEAVRSTAKQSF